MILPFIIVVPLILQEKGLHFTACVLHVLNVQLVSARLCDEMSTAVEPCYRLPVRSFGLLMMLVLL